MKEKFPLYALLFLTMGLVAGMTMNHYWPVLKAATVPEPARQLDKLSERRYACPMHPEIVKNAPGHCPICGMDLVAREPHPEHEAEMGGLPTVIISSAVINNIGVHTLPVIRQTLWRQAKVSGYIQGYNPGGKRALRVPVAGRIVALHVKPGQWVHQGDVLFELDVPDRAEAQAQHLALLASGEQMKLEASRQHLRELGSTGPDIEQLEKTRKPDPTLKIYAPQDSQISEVAFHNGDNVTPASAVAMLQTMGEALVDVDVFQSQVLWLKSGDRAELRIHNLPGQVWKGSVSLEGLRVNPEHRTYGVRLSFAMPEELVKGDMFGEVKFLGAPKRNVLTIMREALIRTEQGNRVVIALGGGRFQPVKVKTGIESDGRVEVISGLKEGQSVVVSAQFLLDSESSMRAEFMRMDDRSADSGKNGEEPILAHKDSRSVDPDMKMSDTVEAKH